MNRYETYEMFLYFAALAAGCCIAVPLRLNESKLEGQCLLFAELNTLTSFVVMGNARYCTFVFFSSIANAALAFILGFVKLCCCIVETQSQSLVYVYSRFITCILSVVAWINCLVCTIFLVIGFTGWCNSIKNNRNIESCKEAEKWDWTQFEPAGIDGSKFHTFLFIAEIASYCAVVIWFVIVLLSGTNFRQSLFRTRAEYYFTDDGMQYPAPPVYELPAYDIKSERGSYYL